MVRIQEHLKVSNIKDESKVNKKEDRKVTIRTVKLEGDKIAISISAEKSSHVLGQLSRADLGTEAVLELEIYDKQLKIDSNF